MKQKNKEYSEEYVLVKINKELKKYLKVRAAQEDRSMQEILNEIVKKEREQNGKV